MCVGTISFKPRSKTYFSVTVHSVHSNTLRDAQKSCIRMISRHTSRVSCELRSRKTPRRMSPVNSNLFHTSDQLIEYLPLSVSQGMQPYHPQPPEVVYGLMKFAVPTDTAVAPAIRNSRASSAVAIPPIPMTGIFTAWAA